MLFFQCEECGTLVEALTLRGKPVCCGQPMKQVEPNTKGAAEKHTPVVSVEGNCVTVSVSEVTHPMTEEHLILWIAVETTTGLQKKYLKPGEAPVAVFVLAEGETVTAAYAYCNLHGLWQS